jgi:hypothetical protein
MRLFRIFILCIVTLSLYACAVTKINVEKENTLPYKRTQKTPSPTVLVAHGCDGWRTLTPPYLCGAMKNYEVYHYANATHAFDMPYKDRRFSGILYKYNEEATTISKERVAQFLKKKLDF